MVDTQNQIRHHYHKHHHKIHNEICHIGISGEIGYKHRHKIVIIIAINTSNTMICFWPLAPWVMEMLKVSWRFPHAGLTLTQTLKKLRILFQLLWSFCWFGCRWLGWRRWWWNLWLGIKVDLWKKLFYEQKQKPQSLWTALEADQGSGKYYHCLIISMIVVMLVVFEKVSTKPLEWGDHVAIFMTMAMMTHICRQFQKPLHQHLRLVVHTLEGKHHRIPCDWGVTGGILIKLWLRFGRYFLQEHLLNYWILCDREGWSRSFDLKFCQ